MYQNVICRMWYGTCMHMWYVHLGCDIQNVTLLLTFFTRKIASFGHFPKNSHHKKKTKHTPRSSKKKVHGMGVQCPKKSQLVKVVQWCERCFPSSKVGQVDLPQIPVVKWELCKLQMWTPTFFLSDSELEPAPINIGSTSLGVSDAVLEHWSTWLEIFSSWPPCLWFIHRVELCLVYWIFKKKRGYTSI